MNGHTRCKLIVEVAPAGLEEAVNKFLADEWVGKNSQWILHGSVQMIGTNTRMLYAQMLVNVRS
jgi:hypothetical protein